MLWKLTTRVRSLGLGLSTGFGCGSFLGDEEAHGLPMDEMEQDVDVSPGVVFRLSKMFSSAETDL